MKYLEELIMKIAVTYDNGTVFQHFGRTEEFKVYEVEGREVISSEIISSSGSGHSALAGILADQGIDLLICGGIGGGAQDALEEAGIGLVAGAQGNTDEVVEAAEDKTPTEEIVNDVVDTVQEETQTTEEAADNLQEVVDQLQAEVDSLKAENEELKKKNQKMSKQPSTKVVTNKKENNVGGVKGAFAALKAQGIIS